MTYPRPLQFTKIEQSEVMKKGSAKLLQPGGDEEPGAAKPSPLRCRFHDLRHSAVTRLLEAGIPYPVVASIMGWSAATAIRMAKRYGHIGQKSLREAMDVLGAERNGSASLKKSPKSTVTESVVLQ